MYQATVKKYAGATMTEAPDFLAEEEPLEIRIEYGPAEARLRKSLSVTMRTPGADEDLVAGFLRTEGLLSRPEDLLGLDSLPGANVVTARLHPDLDFRPENLERHFYTTSSCGVCGKTSIEAVEAALGCAVPATPAPLPPAEVLYGLPDALRKAQTVFDATGGLHASALFDEAGHLLCVREDVGRHNALDKLLGHYFRLGQLPLDRHILLLSGRASFELLQKSAMGGLRLVCAVGAPSSLAVDTARTFGISLVGFLRDNRFNLYS